LKTYSTHVHTTHGARSIYVIRSTWYLVLSLLQKYCSTIRTHPVRRTVDFPCSISKLLEYWSTGVLVLPVVVIRHLPFAICTYRTTVRRTAVNSPVRRVLQYFVACVHSVPDPMVTSNILRSYISYDSYSRSTVLQLLLLDTRSTGVLYNGTHYLPVVRVLFKWREVEILCKYANCEPSHLGGVYTAKKFQTWIQVSKFPTES
jgi:hypothetical protein